MSVHVFPTIWPPDESMASQSNSISKPLYMRVAWMAWNALMIRECSLVPWPCFQDVRAGVCFNTSWMGASASHGPSSYRRWASCVKLTSPFLVTFTPARSSRARAAS
eukprot:207835-Karenia_brevis.AAC.1